MRCFRSPVLSLQKRQAPICGFRPCLYPEEWVSDSFGGFDLEEEEALRFEFLAYLEDGGGIEAVDVENL